MVIFTKRFTKCVSPTPIDGNLKEIAKFKFAERFITLEKNALWDNEVKYYFPKEH